MDKSETYYLKFDPHKYLQYYTEVSATYKFPLKAIHDMFQSYKATPAGLKVLDFGCGPIPVYQCSATPYVSEIVFAEYTEVLQRWLDKDLDAFDFTPFFKYVIEDLEGKGEDEVIKRQDELRALVKGVIPCDILSDVRLLQIFLGNSVLEKKGYKNITITRMAYDDANLMEVIYVMIVTSIKQYFWFLHNKLSRIELLILHIVCKKPSQSFPP